MNEQQEWNPFPLSPADQQYIACYGATKFMEMRQSQSDKDKLERLRDEFAMAAMTSIITVAEKAGWHWKQSEGFLETVGQGRDKSNASRIVACVNACAGIPNSVLKVFAQPNCNILTSNELANQKLKNITEQRDELLAALKYHQAQTRPILSTIEIIEKCENKS